MRVLAVASRRGLCRRPGAHPAERAPFHPRSTLFLLTLAAAFVAKRTHPLETGAQGWEISMVAGGRVGCGHQGSGSHPVSAVRFIGQRSLFLSMDRTWHRTIPRMQGKSPRSVIKLQGGRTVAGRFLLRCAHSFTAAQSCRTPLRYLLLVFRVTLNLPIYAFVHILHHG